MIDPHKRPVLGDDTLKLRAPITADIDARFAFGSHADVLKMFGVDPAKVEPLTHKMAERWVDYHLQEPHAFMIEYEGALVGDVRLHLIVEHEKCASLAISLLDPDLFDQGIGTQAISLILDYAFGPLGLNRVALRVVEYNTRAIATYTKLGFVHEGVERQAARLGNAYHDVIVMGLLESEWRT